MVSMGVGDVPIGGRDGEDQSAHVSGIRRGGPHGPMGREIEI